MCGGIIEAPKAGWGGGVMSRDLLQGQKPSLRQSHDSGSCANSEAEEPDVFGIAARAREVLNFEPNLACARSMIGETRLYYLWTCGMHTFGKSTNSSSQS